MHHPRRTFMLLTLPIAALAGLFLLQRPSTSAPPAAAQAERTGMKVHALRLKPGQDLKQELQSYVNRHGIEAGFILTCVGSLQKAALRLADRQETTTVTGKREIVSLVGTISTAGAHLHISLSDPDGKTVGGHLVDGSEIYTTAEIVIGEARDLRFTREDDAQTGFRELAIHRK